MQTHLLKTDGALQALPIQDGDIVYLDEGEWNNPLIIHNMPMIKGIVIMPIPLPGAVVTLPQLIVTKNCKRINIDGFNRLRIIDEAAGQDDELVTLYGAHCYITRSLVSGNEGFADHLDDIQRINIPRDLLVDLPNGIGLRGFGCGASHNDAGFLRYGVQGFGLSSMIEHNDIKVITGDHWRLLNHGSTAEGNINTLSYNVNPREHNDAGQMWNCTAESPQKGQLTGLRIHKNIAYLDSTLHELTAPCQGFGVYDGGITDSTITENVVCTDHDLGITIGLGSGNTISGNKVFHPRPDQAGNCRPRIQIGTNKPNECGLTDSGNWVEDNDAADYLLQTLCLGDDVTGSLNRRMPNLIAQREADLLRERFA